MTSFTQTHSPEDLFGVHALPYGRFLRPGVVDDDGARIGVRLGNTVVDLCALVQNGPVAKAGAWTEALTSDTLDELLACSRTDWAAARAWLQETLADADLQAMIAEHTYPLDQVHMLLPFTVADYVDCYASEQHASNLSQILRPENPQLPVNWKHIPIGYHGRSGTIVVSGTDVPRPCGQRKAPSDAAPAFGPSIKLDIECELGFVVGGRERINEPVSIAEAREHLFGVVILNDWSARDIQGWEYVPLGPFLGKSFATTISAWVLPLEALESAMVDVPTQSPEPFPYLQGSPQDIFGLDVRLEVELNGTVVSTPPYKEMYWSPAQMLAHMTVNGASCRPGDLFGSGTISGNEPATRGSFIELSWNGTQPFQAGGKDNTFLQDGDTVVMRAYAPGANGTVVGLGECVGTITAAVLPASSPEMAAAASA